MYLPDYTISFNSQEDFHTYLDDSSDILTLDTTYNSALYKIHSNTF